MAWVIYDFHFSKIYIFHESFNNPSFLFNSIFFIIFYHIFWFIKYFVICSTELFRLFRATSFQQTFLRDLVKKYFCNSENFVENGIDPKYGGWEWKDSPKYNIFRTWFLPNVVSRYHREEKSFFIWPGCFFNIFFNKLFPYFSGGYRLWIGMCSG